MNLVRAYELIAEGLRSLGFEVKGETVCNMLVNGVSVQIRSPTGNVWHIYGVCIKTRRMQNPDILLAIRTIVDNLPSEIEKQKLVDELEQKYKLAKQLSSTLGDRLSVTLNMDRYFLTFRTEEYLNVCLAVDFCESLDETPQEIVERKAKPRRYMLRYDDTPQGSLLPKHSLRDIICILKDYDVDWDTVDTMRIGEELTLAPYTLRRIQ